MRGGRLPGLRNRSGRSRRRPPASAAAVLDGASVAIDAGVSRRPRSRPRLGRRVGCSSRSARAVKDPDEIALIRAAIAVCDAGRRRPAHAAPGMSELDALGGSPRCDGDARRGPAARARRPRLGPPHPRGRRPSERSGPSPRATSSSATSSRGSRATGVTRARHSRSASRPRLPATPMPAAARSWPSSWRRRARSGSRRPRCARAREARLPAPHGSRPRHRLARGAADRAGLGDRARGGDGRSLLEPGSYGEAGVRVEQVVLVTADGCEMLSGHELAL